MNLFTDAIGLLKIQGEVTVLLRVRPSASRTATTRQLADGSIKIDLAAPAEDGKANAEMIRFLAKAFAVPRTHVDILTGATARQKAVRIWK